MVTLNQAKEIKLKYFLYNVRHLKKLPMINPIIMEERDEIGTFVYTSNNEMEEAISNNKPIPFHYHADLFSYLPEYINAILEHEFTHISDFVKYRGSEKITDIMTTYSEFHATQIEFMKLCGIRRVTTKCKKSLTDKIAFCNEMVTVDEYIQIQLAQILAILEEDKSVLEDDMLAANAAALVKHMMYFFGAISFYYDSNRDLIYKYFIHLKKYGYMNMAVKMFGNVLVKKFESNIDEYSKDLLELEYKYLEI